MPRVPSIAAQRIGERIRLIRAEGVAISQDDLSSLSGIDSSNIRAYETGRAMPNIHSLVRIATALGVTPGELLEGLTLEDFQDAAGRRRVAA